MDADVDYRYLDGLAIAEGIRNRRFSVLEIIDCALQRAEQLNPSLNAITVRTFDQARDRAVKLADSQAPVDQPFFGVPFLIKDIAAVRGLPQTRNSHLFDGEKARYDDAIVRAFAACGLVSLGKTNTPELCLTVTTESDYAGPCHNPWHPGHSAGGSSGGSAAAVAAGIVPVAHASDGGGSIRIPASCCGIVGFKPSRGLTPVEAELASSWSGLSVAHVVSRTVRDSAAMLDAIRLRKPVLYPLPEGPDSFLHSLDQRQKLRIAVQREHPLGATVHPQVQKSLDIATDLLKQAGHEVAEASPGIDYRQLMKFSGDIINLHVAQAIFPQLEKRGENLDTPLLEKATNRMAARGKTLAARDYVAAIDGLHGIAMDMEAFHRRYDVLVSPVLSQPPAPLGWLDMNSEDLKTYAQRFAQYSGFCALFNATGQPSVSLPIHHDSENLPIGVLFSSTWGSDARLLQLAQQLENEIQWCRRQPRDVMHGQA